MNEIIIKTVDFDHEFQIIEKIRTSVFINEQNVPFKLEWDEFDAESTHFIAYYNNEAVGTARLLHDGHIGRMAVLKTYRNRSIGENMLKYILKLAQQKKMNKIELSAQEQAIEFYKKYGFSIISDMYLDAEIPHFDMIYNG